MKIYKIYLKALLLIPMLMMAFLSVINYVADPFQIYHDSFLNKGRYIKQQERFQNAGLIRELWRDESCCTSLMLGTSMSQNFDGAKIGSILKSGNVLNLAMSGASPQEEYLTLTKVAEIRTPKIVLWELHTTFKQQNKSDEISHAGSAKFFPQYLYDSNIFNDYPYIMSASNFLYIPIQMQSGLTLYGHKEWYTEQASSFGHGQDVYKTSLPLRIKNIRAPSSSGKNFYTIGEYILPAVKKYKDAQFIFYFPPYSLHSHASEKPEDFLHVLAFRTALVDALAEHQNAAIFMFDDILNDTGDLDKYKDVSHYDLDIGNQAIGMIANRQGLLTSDNLNRRLNALISRANEYCHQNKADCVSN